MPLISCPKCPTKLRVPDGAAGNAQCPKCHAQFPIYIPTPEEAPKPATPKSSVAPKPPVQPKSSVAPKPVITPKPPPKSSVPSKPAAKFEVVDDDEPSPPPKPAAKPKAAPPKAQPPQPLSLDTDEEAKPKKKKSIFDHDDDEDEKPNQEKSIFDHDDDEDELPSKKKQLFDVDDEEEEKPKKKKSLFEVEDEEDEKPRSRRHQRDDDDDEDDRPRSKRRRDDDDDDEVDEDWHRAPKKKGPPGFGNAKTGVLLLNISFWLYGISLAIITFFLFLAVVGAFDPSSSTTTTTTRTTTRGGMRTEEEVSSSRSGSAIELVVKLPGILGVGNWLVAAIGFGFCIAGPAKARGLAITATSLAGAHILFLAISIGDVGKSLGGFGSMGGGDDAVWLLGATTLPVLDTLLPIFLYGVTKELGSTYLFLFLAAACELARIIFAMILVKRLAEVAKDYDAAEKAQLGVLGAAVAGGGSVLVALGLALLAKMEAINGVTSARILGGGSILLIFSAFTLMTVMPVFSTLELWKTLTRKTRSK